MSYKVLVMCPPHLVAKWPREVTEVVSTSGIQPVTRIVRDIADMIAFRKEADADWTDRPHWAVISSEIAKLGSGWRGAAPASCRRFVTVVTTRDDGTEIESRTPAFTCPRCGETVCMEVAEGDPKPVVDPAVITANRLKCLVCKEPLYQAARDRWGNAKWPIATYIHRKMRSWFDLAIVDEVHESKGQSTDRGHAMSEIAASARRVIALTGTLFGGTASSVFYLLHRLSAEFRHEYSWKEAGRFVDRFGIREITHYGNDSERVEGHGVLSGLKRERTVVRERPGVSPELIRLFLGSTAFLSLPDLGYAMPPYSEIPHPIPMTDEMRKAYTKVEKYLRETSRKNPRRLGEYLQTTLCWPNAPWRETFIPDFGHMPLIHEGEPTPKEKWLADLVAGEVADGRKCLVFCRQTGTKDIQPRLAHILESAGVRALTLHSNVPPHRREAWVKDRQTDIDALITNARLIATGLDLCQFSTTIFYEPDYSLYVVAQAARRTWRLGQTQPVRVYYPTWEGSMEHRALGIIGKKIVAAQLLYGDDVSAAFAEDQGGSLLEELAKEAASATRIPDLRDLFRKEDEHIFDVEISDEEDVSVSLSPLETVPEIIPKRRFSRAAGDAIQLSLF